VSSRELILAVLREAGKDGIQTTEIAESVGVDISTVNKRIKAMKREGVPIAYIFRRISEGKREKIRPFHVYGRTKDAPGPPPLTNRERMQRYRKNVKGRSLNSVFNLGLTTRKAIAVVTRGMTTPIAQAFD